MATRIVPIMTPALAAPIPTQGGASEATSAMEGVLPQPATPERAVRGTSVKLSVPLDDVSDATPRATTSVNTSRKLLRRDSLDRREALLKGKEGSRQRRRWENGQWRFLGTCSP